MSSNNIENIEYRYNPDLEIIHPNWKGNPVIDGIYCNERKKDRPPLWSVVKWKFSRNPQRKEKKNDTFALKTVKDLSFLNHKEDIIIWLGHASFYIRLDEMVYLTDPCFSDLPTSKRYIQDPYSIEELGKIDYILISHTHYDHFDIPTLKTITQHNPDIMILGPLGMGELLSKKVDNNVLFQEAGWYQTFSLDKTNQINFLPAKHWNRRGLKDFNTILWGSFAIKSSKVELYFAGDTGMWDHFEEIATLYPKGFDFCLMPIGAYMPKFLMEEEHIDPEEALLGFKTLKGKHFIPMHYGTYDLSDEPMGEPSRLMDEMSRKQNISDRILHLQVGEQLRIIHLDSYL